MYRFILFLLTILLLSCDPPVQEQCEPQTDQVTEHFVDANRYMHRRHQDHIAAFIERVGWDAGSTSSGLWFVIRDPGDGEPVREGARVSYSFESLLLDGTPCYRADEQNPKVVTVGRGGIETGAEEGLRMLREGAEAVFLIPPHLAHGNFGDRNKIPGNTVLIYKVSILQVQPAG